MNSRRLGDLTLMRALVCGKNCRDENGMIISSARIRVRSPRRRLFIMIFSSG